MPKVRQVQTSRMHSIFHSIRYSLQVHPLKRIPHLFKLVLMRAYIFRREESVVVRPVFDAIYQRVNTFISLLYVFSWNSSFICALNSFTRGPCKLFSHFNIYYCMQKQYCMVKLSTLSCLLWLYLHGIQNNTKSLNYFKISLLAIAR